ncbi:MAG TPA: 2-succinyl-5-enolpyruvyl-6-hydroxy-3-cyclohexene-1-carboxylic-acid synthase [Actinomycetota bacterium]|nr:2-succinyl-5-enolpyruvyl-6-hydroxy-3-cyclohexene-1-carboxylic-acid synthase [Actinomycetota bacterium]
MSEGDVALACVSAFVNALTSFGLRDACVSPGSRSTPIALALARNESVRVHVHLDERSSAFFALGLAKTSGVPTAVVTTSGTAAANLFPAIVEASMSRVPLIALTADRPPELRGVGANQTIDQIGLFGKYASWFLDAQVPAEGSDAGRSWYTLGVHTYREACRGGPVHVNLPFREPLVPSGQSVDLGERFALGLAGVGLGEGEMPEDDQVAEFADVITGGGDGLVFVGGLRVSGRWFVDLGDRLGWPVIAEPISGCRIPGTLGAAQHLLADADFADAHAPELFLQIGASPTSRPALEAVRRARRLIIVDPDELVADPNRRAEKRFTVHAGNLVDRALDAITPSSGGSWLSSWREADRRATDAVEALLDSWDEPFEGRIARDLAASIPDGGVLVVGSSMPVRDLDAYMRPREGLRVLANRGASGIDGFVSTALGVSASGAATTALCGDLTLLHDIGSLIWSAGRGLDCVVVVPNNDGGAIFSFLPQRELPEFEELFATPHGLDLGAISRAAGAGHARIEHAADLMPTVERARGAGGVYVVEVPIDRARNLELHAAVRETVAAALGRTM